MPRGHYSRGELPEDLRLLAASVQSLVCRGSSPVYNEALARVYKARNFTPADPLEPGGFGIQRHAGAQQPRRSVRRP